MELDPKLIGEAWQAMSVISDAQEMLGLEEGANPDLEASNERMNHAKRHLIQFFNMVREADEQLMSQGVVAGTMCSLPEEQEYHDLEMLVCPLTRSQVGQVYDECVRDSSSIPRWQDLEPEQRGEVLGIAERLLYVEGGELTPNFDDAFCDRLRELWA